MAASLNLSQLIGRLGADPELRYTGGGSAVVTLSVATNERTKDRESGEWREVTAWHRVAVFGRTAENVAEYLGKGSLVYVAGSLRTRKWEDKAGVERWSTEIVAREVQFLDPRGSGAQDYAAASRGGAAARGSAPAGQDDLDLDDEIPW